MGDGRILPIEKGFDYQHLVLTYLLLTRHPRISWKYEEIDDVLSVDNTLTEDRIDIYTVRSSTNYFDIKSLFCGKRSILKPFLRSYAKIILLRAQPRLFLVTNRKIDKDAEQIFFKMERIRQGNLAIENFEKRGGSDEKLFHKELKKMLSKSKMKYGIKIDKGNFLRSIYRPIVVDEDEGARTIKDRLINDGKINPNDVDDKFNILLTAVAKEQVCSIEWVDSLLGTQIKAHWNPIFRKAAEKPEMSISDLKKINIKEKIADREELISTKETIRQLKLHLKAGNLHLSSSEWYTIMTTLERAEKNMEKALDSADSTDGFFINIKRDIEYIFKSLEDKI